MPTVDNMSLLPHVNYVFIRGNGQLYIPCVPPAPHDGGPREQFRGDFYFRWYYAEPSAFFDLSEPKRLFDYAVSSASHDLSDETFAKMTRMGDNLVFNSVDDELILYDNYTFPTGWYAITIMDYVYDKDVDAKIWKEIWPWGFNTNWEIYKHQFACFVFNEKQYRFISPVVHPNTIQRNEDLRPKVQITPDERPTVTLTTTVKPTKCKAVVSPKELKNIKQGETEEAVVKYVPDGWKFFSWHKDATGQDLSTTITMDKNKEAIALFEQDKVGVNIIIQPSGSGRVIPSEVTEVLHGDILTLMAIPDSGYNFKRWVANDGSTISEQQTYGHKITTSTNITAEFEQVKFSVQFKRHGDGAGRLQVDGEEINESTLALGTTKKYNLNKQISIKAIANDDSRFVAWEDGTTNIERQITVDAQHVVRPLFLKYPKNDLVPVFSFIPHCEVVSV